MNLPPRSFPGKKNLEFVISQFYLYKESQVPGCKITTSVFNQFYDLACNKNIVIAQNILTLIKFLWFLKTIVFIVLSLWRYYFINTEIDNRKIKK